MYEYESAQCYLCADLIVKKVDFSVLIIKPLSPNLGSSIKIAILLSDKIARHFW